MSYSVMLHCGRYDMRPQGSPAELERRRLRAMELLQRDIPVHAVADRLGVDRRSVRRWKRMYRRQGRAGLRARPAAGRPPKLSAAQRARLTRLVLAGPEAAGYRTSWWTCRRIVDLIRHHFHVRYHPDHVGRLLRACGFSPQRPQPRAKERDDRRIREWLHRDWARVKKTPPPRRPPDLPR
jgi:transposase